MTTMPAKIGSKATSTQEIKGKQFDPHVVRAFCRLLLKEITSEAPRVLTSTAGRGYDREMVLAALIPMVNLSAEACAAATG
jgi:hypothetical protein